MTKKITCEQVVLALKAHRLSTTAASIAARMGTDSRAVATAVRAAVKDGRVTRHYKKAGKGQQVCAYYRFMRLKPPLPL